MGKDATLRVNKVHYPVTALGPGNRLGIWVQGCSIGCAGCLSRDTWDPDPAAEAPVDDILAWCRQLCPAGADGVTISGGEPFEQPAGLSALLQGLREWSSTLTRPMDILCYSGLPLATLRDAHPNLLQDLDVLIPEPYQAGGGDGGALTGSGNQSIVVLTELGRVRFAPHLHDADSDPSLQLHVAGGRIWMIGVPRHGDLARMTRGLRARGVSMDQVSWRP